MAAAIHTTPCTITISSWQKSLMSACQANIPDWIQTSKKINGLLQESRPIFHNACQPEELKAKLQNIVAQMCVLEQEVKIAQQFEHRFVEHLDSEKAIMTDPAPSIFEAQFSTRRYQYRSWRTELDRCIDLNLTIARRVHRLIGKKITKPWEELSTEVEAVLAKTEKSVGLSAVWGYLPKRLGGGWPYRDAAFEEYKKQHAAEIPSIRPRPFEHVVPTEPSDPPTSEETQKALKEAVQEVGVFFLNGFNEMEGL